VPQEAAKEKLSADALLAQRLKESAQRLRAHVPPRLSHDPEVDRRARVYIAHLERSLLAAAEALRRAAQSVGGCDEG
jgi:hypothetical protein